jgi:hypothetical protein
MDLSGFIAAGAPTVVRPTATRFWKHSGFVQEAQRSAHDRKPRLRDPVAVFALWIGWIEQMPG